MKESTVYFRDVDRGDTIVRKRPGMMELEFISERFPEWKKTWPNCSYEREYYFGQGNNCLFEISFEYARFRIAEWGVELTDEDR